MIIYCNAIIFEKLCFCSGCIVQRSDPQFIDFPTHNSKNLAISHKDRFIIIYLLFYYYIVNLKHVSQQVMIATYLLLNYPEKELLNWRNMQALLGKTGKEGLKRQVTSLDPLRVDMPKADYAFEKYLTETDLEIIRDTSAGAATFYVWVSVLQIHLDWFETSRDGGRHY